MARRLFGSAGALKALWRTPGAGRRPEPKAQAPLPAAHVAPAHVAPAHVAPAPTTTAKADAEASGVFLMGCAVAWSKSRPGRAASTAPVAHLEHRISPGPGLNDLQPTARCPRLPPRPPRSTWRRPRLPRSTWRRPRPPRLPMPLWRQPRRRRSL